MSNLSCIDAVYMWVDGSDPIWQKNLKDRLSNLSSTSNIYNKDVASNSSKEHSFFKTSYSGRFNDNDELRYSLRSIATYAPWIRKVHIITANQTPKWINSSTVNLVNHEDIFEDHSSLPVFSNRPIEFCQHKIKDLSELFISFNDDFMLGSKVNPTDFFTKEGKPIVWAVKTSKSSLKTMLQQRQSNTHSSSVKKAHSLIFDRFKTQIPFKFKHYPRPATISSIKSLINDFPSQVTTTLQSPFRTFDDISLFPLYQLYLLATNQGELRKISGLNLLLDFIDKRMAHVGASLGDANYTKKTARILKYSPQTFCLNDSKHATEEERSKLKNFLESKFPIKSKFEI